MARYQPELGQMIFGQPHKELEVPRYVEAALTLIREELCRVGHNVYQSNFADPFGNTGASFKELPEFQVEAYCWDDDIDQHWNFKYGDLEISWYKYLGRGMSMNRETSPAEMAKMIDGCIEALQKFEKEKLPNLF